MFINRSLSQKLKSLLRQPQHAPAKPWRRLLKRLDKPLPALPLDIFRIGAGLLTAAYFAHIRRDISDFSSPNGLIDHRLTRRLFPYTRLTLYNPRMTDRHFRRANDLAITAALLLTLGVSVRPASALLYAIAVSTYRWNFLVMYVDDAIMHIVLFWLLLLPIGETLTLPGLLAGGDAAWRRWRAATVPGLTVRLFTANLALLYLVAGLWKWRSPLWRQGLALYATLKMPIARTPSLWRPSNLPLLRPSSYLAMAIEPLLALLPLLPRGSRPKLILGAGQIAFHLGIVATLMIPYANIACIAALPLFFGDELMQWVDPQAAWQNVPPTRQTGPTEAAVAVAVMLLLTLSNIWRLGDLKPPPASRSARALQLRRLLGFRSELWHHKNPWSALLWLFGIAQSYRLFDWIDERNINLTYVGEQRLPNGQVRPFDCELLFPHQLRHVLLTSYLHNESWILPPRAEIAALQRSLYHRYVQRYCRANPGCGEITVWVTTCRITAANLDQHHATRTKMLHFRCSNGTPDIISMHLSGES